MMVGPMHILSSTEWYVTHVLCEAGRFPIGREVDLGENSAEVLAAITKAPGISATEVPSTTTEEND